MVFHVDVQELKEKLENERRIRILLIVICIVLAMASIAFIVSYIIVENKYASAVNLCKTDHCMRSAATLRLAMNTSVDPCDDFYRFACDRWTAEHPDHGWFSPVSAFSMVEEAVTAATLKFLQTNSSKKERLPVKQSRDLFASCMNQEAADKLKYRPIFKYLSLLGLPAIPTFMNLTSDKNYTKDKKFDWVHAEALSTRLLGLQSIIGFSVVNNETNNKQHFITMGAPPQINYQLPSFLRPLKHQYIKSKKHSKAEKENDVEYELFERRKAMINFFIHTVVKANYTEYSELPDDFIENVDRTTNTIMELIDKMDDLYSIAIPPSNCTNSTTDCAAYFGVTIDELQEKTNKLLKASNMTPKAVWKSYLKEIFKGLNVNLDLNKKVTIYVDKYDVKYLGTIVRYMSELPDELIELWLWWKTVLQLIMNTTSDIKKYFEDLSMTTFDQPKQLRCVATTIEYMGMAVSYAIADKIILKETRQTVEDMILDIKIAFTQRIKRIKWMDKKTKKLTLEKCKAMLSLVGYPDWLMKPGALEKYYAKIIIHPNTYLDNMVSVIQRNVRMDLLKLNTGHERDWPQDTYPVTVNAFHVPWDNSIIVPMAFLFYPLYNLGMEVLNYAATGSTLGHELIHGFDNTGRQYDKYGNNIQWWDDEVIEEFEDLAECFVKQYNKFYVPEVDIYVNGEISLGENIADNDGLRLAYMAYKNYKKRNKKEQKLPGLEQYTQDQMFFIAYASTWCDELKQDNMAYYEEEPHCPKMFRLIGSLQNSEEFARAFKCPKGSRMNPNVRKCSIW